MAFSRGADAHFEVDNSGGTLTDISAYVDDATLDRVAEMHETTVFELSSKTYIPGLEDGTIEIGGPWDPTLDSTLEGILAATTSRSFEYGPAGSATSDVRYTGECWITNFNINTGVGGRAEWTASLQITGDVTRDTYP